MDHLISVLFGDCHSLVLRVNAMITKPFKSSVKVFEEILFLFYSVTSLSCSEGKCNDYNVIQMQCKSV